MRENQLAEALPDIWSVLDLKQKTTYEVCGPCPKCGGNDRFIVKTQPGKDGKGRDYSPGDFWCRGCGWGGDKIAFFMDYEQLEFRDLLEKYQGRPPAQSRKPKKWDFIEKYDYHDQSGNVAYCVKKFIDQDGEKQFVPYRKNGHGWKAGIKGHVGPIPYNLPAVIKSPTVYLVEGEKDVNTAKKHGIPASCNPGGARNWNDCLNTWFEGKNIVLVPDNDKSGFEHANIVAGKLFPLAKQIKIVKLPGLPEKGDLTDFFEAGKTKEDLFEIVKRNETLSESEISTQNEKMKRNETLPGKMKRNETLCNDDETLPKIKNHLLGYNKEIAKIVPEWGEVVKVVEKNIHLLKNQHVIQMKRNETICPEMKRLCNDYETQMKRSEISSGSILEWLEEIDGVFTTRDIWDQFSIRDGKQKSYLRTILKRLVEKDVIKLYGGKAGQYRKIDKTLVRMDLKSVETTTVNMHLPLGLHEMAKIYPGSIICFAGERNSGKSAFMMDIAKNNRNDYDIHYFNSEAGAEEIVDRMQNDPYMSPDDWDKINFHSRSRNFGDVIRPGKNNINIIDYITEYEKFYLIAKAMDEIHEALDGAVAVVSIQKPKGREFGVGGEHTLDIPRLYVALGFEKAKVVKCKGPVDPRNHPGGQSCSVRIRDGWDISRMGPWRRE